MKLFWFVMMGLVLIMAGCGQKDKGAGASAHGGFAVPVVGVKVVLGPIQEKISVVGSLVANEAVEIKSKVEGRVMEILFEEGQAVLQGDRLIVLDGDELQAEVAQAQANLDMAQTTFNRMNTLVGQGAVSKQEFDQAQSQLAAMKANVELNVAKLKEMVITAPFDGIAAERKVSLGQVIGKDMLLTSVIDGNPMKVYLNIPERYIDRLREDQVIELNVAAYSSEIFKGTVYFIDPQVDSATRTVLVKAKVDNSDGKLYRGMFAKINLIIDEKPQAVIIPEIALISKSDEVYVFTVDAEGKAKMNLVKTGIRLAGLVEILSGINAGDTVITEGFQKIGPGSPVNVVTPESPPQGPAS